MPTACPRSFIIGEPDIPAFVGPIDNDVEQGQRVHAAIHLSKPITPTGRAEQMVPWRAMPIKQISQRPGFARISELLSKDTPTELEDRILKAIQWAGRARIETRVEESFLLFAVALETLALKNGNQTEIGFQLRFRIAHLLAGPDLSARQLVIKQIKELYGTRSKIVHSGKFDVTNSELQLIDEYTRIGIFVVLCREPFTLMSTEKEFEAWFEAKLLGITQSEGNKDSA